MSRLFIETRGLGDWRCRLCHPDRQWKRSFSAFETAVSWERAGQTEVGLPPPVANLLAAAGYDRPVLEFAVAEHKVPLLGGGGAPQCDVWGVVRTAKGRLSLSVEAKALEEFGGEPLGEWLKGGKSPRSPDNRRRRRDQILQYLPSAHDYTTVRYQILHRCAAAVIEAERLGLEHAAFVVQAFGTPADRFADFEEFCRVAGVAAKRGTMAVTSVGPITLGIGWADCPFATDKDVADVA